MKRRAFTHAAVSLATLAAASLAVPAWAQRKKPEAGTDYEILNPAVPVTAPKGKVEVVEFFWYGCPHCNAFEPTLAPWVKALPKVVVFKRLPVAFRAEFIPHQRLYFSLEAMGLVDKLHHKVFDAIHKDHATLNSEQTIGAWVAKQGVDKAKFLATYNSAAITAKAAEATRLQDLYKIDGVPSLGVAGRFYTSVSMAQGPANVLRVVESLIEDVRTGG